MSPAVLAVVLAVASLIVLVGGGGAVCNALLGSMKRRATPAWRAVLLQFLFGVLSFVAVVVPIMLARQHYEALVAANRAAPDVLALFDALVRIVLTIAAPTTAAAMGVLSWPAHRGGRRRHARRSRWTWTDMRKHAMKPEEER